MGWYTAQCKMLLFCVKTVVKVSHNFDLACLKNKKKRKKEKHFGHLVTFWFGTFAMLFRATGHVFCHENTQNEQYVVIKAFKFTILKVFHLLHFPTYRVYQLYDTLKLKKKMQEWPLWL